MVANQMHDNITPALGKQRLTIGVLVSWQVYEGTAIGRYLHALLRGIRTAATDQGCHLLLACGIGDIPRLGNMHAAWPMLTPDVDFVPVGPWNTDGLIVVAPTVRLTQQHYIQDLRSRRHPVIFVSSGESHPGIAPDNAAGMQQAIAHLVAHGHHRIAFIAGYPVSDGDSNERLLAYQHAMMTCGLPIDPALIVYGQHATVDSYRAMQGLLATNSAFTAVVTSNDVSALGVLQALQEARLAIPHDVALIAFDDFIDADAMSPPLTTIRHSAFYTGYQACTLLHQILRGEASPTANVRVPTQIMIRQSCGCQPGTRLVQHISLVLQSPTVMAAIAQDMAEAVLDEVPSATLMGIIACCKQLIAAYVANLSSTDVDVFQEVVTAVLHHPDLLNDAYSWHAAIRVLYARVGGQIDDVVMRRHADTLCTEAHHIISTAIQRRATPQRVRHNDVADLLRLMTADFLATLDVAQIPAVLAAYLPHLGVRHLVAARFRSADHDSLDAGDADIVAHSEVILEYGLDTPTGVNHFITRRFPPPHLYPADRPYQLALLPLHVQNQIDGFIAFDAANLEPCGVIARNLAGTLRSSYLYREAAEGRRLADAANQLKSRFLSMVSHELRTPLNLIVGLIKMLQRDYATQTGTATPIAQDIEQIHLSAQHLGRLINDVLDLASSEDGRLQLVREPTDLSDALQVMVRTGEQMARRKGIQWQSHLPERGPWISGDHTRLRQVVLNLVSNAVKFTSSGSITLVVREEASQAVIIVADTGIGVPLVDQGRIFDEFYRAEQIVTHGYSGLGLGLTTCKQLVELHDGTITMRSSGRAGEGTTFVVRLPLLAPPANQPHQEHSIALPVALLAAQQHDALPLVQHLTAQGFTVHRCIVTDEQPALAQIIDLAPGAIILDATLATQSGAKLVESLKHHPVTAHIPVLLYGLDAQRDHGVSLELHTALKPLNADRLSQLLEHLNISAVHGMPRPVLVVDDDGGIADLHMRSVMAQHVKTQFLPDIRRMDY